MKLGDSRIQFNSLTVSGFGGFRFQGSSFGANTTVFRTRCFRGLPRFHLLGAWRVSFIESRTPYQQNQCRVLGNSWRDELGRNFFQMDYVLSSARVQEAFLLSKDVCDLVILGAAYVGVPRNGDACPFRNDRHGGRSLLGTHKGRPYRSALA